MLIARILPKPIYNKLYPKWARIRMVWDYFHRSDLRLYFCKPIFSWVAEKKISGTSVSLAVRSYREMRRLRNFGADPGHDLVFRWLNYIKDCKVFYDIGASNGVFGFSAHYLHNCKVVFIEPYTPSIESILKSIYVAISNNSAHESFEVVHAGLDREGVYSRLNMHAPPMPGVTMNSFKDSKLYDNIVSRRDLPITITQWLKGVSLDELVFSCGLPAPTHVKIDIDGFESRGIEGALNLLKTGQVHTWSIEINSQANLEMIIDTLANYNYKNIASQVHFPNLPAYNIFPADYIFVRTDLLPQWNNFS